MATTQPDTTTDIDYTFQPVPHTARHGFWAVGFVMLGFTFFSASMSVGAKLGTGLNFNGFIYATLIGGVILAAYTGALALIGAKTGMGVDLLAQRAFGIKGSYLPSALISFTQMGWFGVGVAMFAIPTAELIGINPYWIVIIAGGLMTASAYFGIKAIEFVSYISVPLIATLGTYSMLTAANEAGGLSAVFSENSELALLAGVGMVVGSFISGGSATPNFTRFARSTTTAVLTTVIAFFIGNTLMFSFGAVGGAATQKDDIFYVMIAQGLAIPAILVLGANIWTTNNNALYTTGLGFSNITKIQKRPMTLAAGILGTLTAIWLYNNFIGWLSFLNAALPPIGAILIADYALNHRSYTSPETTVTIKWYSVLAVIAGGLVAWSLPWGITSINAMLVAALIHITGELISKRS